MNYKYSSYFKGLNIIIDFLLLNTSFYLGYLFSMQTWGWENKSEHNWLYIIIINLVWYFSSRSCKLYTDIFSRDSIPTLKATLKSIFLFIIIMLVLVNRLNEYKHYRALFIISIITFQILLLSWKILFLLRRRPKRNSFIDFKPVVIVGAGKNGIDLYKYFNTNTRLGYNVVGFFEDEVRANHHEISILGKIDECIDFVKRSKVEEIFCALPDHANDRISTLMHEADKHMIRFKFVPDVKDHFRKNIMVELYGHLPVLSPRMEPLEDKANQVLKRSFDILFSLLVIAFILSWVYPLLALLIKLESKGPVLFRQIRSGKNNKPFYCLKLRSMTVNKNANKKQATKNDARITKIGKILRKTSLDELPQFINVLKGNMSVVGPRPHMLKHTKEYSGLIDRFMVRHFLTPGITGWAQVNGLRGEIKTHEDMENRVEADIWYLENWSVLLDLKIIFLTIYNVFAGDKNAY